MNLLIKKIAQKISVDYRRLSIVSNPDGLLAIDIVRSLLNRQHGLQIITGSNLQLRIHYELRYKTDTKSHYVYLTQNIESILPDMKNEAYVCRFTIGDVFPFFADKALLRQQPFEVLDSLYPKVSARKISMQECRSIIDQTAQECKTQSAPSAEYAIASISDIVPDWNKPAPSMEAVAKAIISTAQNDGYHLLQPMIENINQSFQDWINREYFATLHSNYLLHPKSVNNILPHLATKHGKGERLALLVIDGFAYWQYIVLRDYLRKMSISTTDGTTLSWLPSITMLSRQAIFKGSDPDPDYRQNPENERKLWYAYWQDRGFGSYEIQYLNDLGEFAINEGVSRLAVVTVEMDEKMHSSSDNKDLLSLTENWCARIVPKIQTILRMGFHLYLTTDHGSIQSQGWRRITQVESVFLYKDGSRGRRHLIYKDTHEQERFYRENKSLPMLRHGNWLAIRNNRCLDREGSTMITHGGCHFLEVVIPFAKITNSTQ